MMVKTQKVNNVVVASFENMPRLNALVAEQVKEELKSLFNKPNARVIINLDGVQFIDSSGFGVFLSVMKVAANNAGKFKICNVAREVMELFKLLQLHNVFDIHPSVDDCLKSFENS
jgi:anti-sigma B factor antagonist